ncbi:MAG: hypothetical protein DRJ61_14230 [Acidobacteria bacterium]
MSNIYEDAVEKFGKDHQLLVTAEELSEAAVKIIQLVNRKRDVEDELIEELADCIIMLRQCKVIYGAELDAAVDRKLKKVAGHVYGS